MEFTFFIGSRKALGVAGSARTMRWNQRRYLRSSLDSSVVHPSSACTRLQLPARVRTSLATRPDLQTKGGQLRLPSEIGPMPLPTTCSSVPLSASAPTVKFKNFIIVLRKNWSGRWDSNPRPQPWQGCALPLSYTRDFRLGRITGILRLSQASV